jgi:DNA-binding protein YbaB
MSRLLIKTQRMNLNKLMKQAQKMQEQMAKAQAELIE